MPPLTAGRSSGATVTYRSPHHLLLERMWHLAQPWMCWAAVTVLGLVLRFAFGPERPLAAGLAVAGGAVILVLDLRQRQHHVTLTGMMIGPVTVAAVTVSVPVFLALGFTRVLVLVYLAGGIAVCVCWDIWMLTADHRDLAAVFNARADATGAPGARMVTVRQPGQQDRGRRGWRRPGSRTVIKAGLQLPGDPAMTAEETAGQVGHFENVTGSPAGSFTLTGLPDHGGLAEVTIAPPSLLTAAPLPWPGPSAPGAGMDVPFRISRLADGRDFGYRRLPVHHRKVAGKTGFGKTETVAWNLIAEGVTRVEYAAVAADIGKGEQFLGPLRPALHHLATDPGDAVRLLAALHRVRLARCGYLAKNHVTEWSPGCGLSFLDVFLEEAADLLRLLGTTARHAGAGQYMAGDWAQDVAESRSAGISWTASFQRPTKDQAVSAVATSQMGSFCFGVAKPDDMMFGLSDEQRQRGARPTLFSTPAHRGMYFADTETVPEDVKAMPQRGWYWGPGSELIAQYAAGHPAGKRPLDDVTGEALEAEPGPLASTAFPPPRRPAAVPGDEGEDEQDGTPPVPSRRRPPAAGPRTRLGRKAAYDAALAQVEQFRAEGRTFITKRDCWDLLDHVVRHHTWLNTTAFPKMCTQGILRLDDGEFPFRWEILPREGDKR